MSDCLQISKRGYYDWHGRVPSKRAAANVMLLGQIEADHLKSDATYGMPRIRAELADQGVVASRKRIATVMRLSHTPRPETSAKDQHRIWSNASLSPRMVISFGWQI